MYIGQKVIAKVDGIVKECTVTEVRGDDLTISDGNKEVIKKYWDVNKVKN